MSSKLPLEIMKIEHRPDGDIGSFIAIEGGKEAGELAYRIINSNTLALDHTDVVPEFEGRGIGKRLILAAVEHAREHKLKIQPICTFAQVLFDRNSEWSDIRC